MKVDDSTPVILIVAVLSGIVKISITEFTITELKGLSYEIDFENVYVN